MNRGAHHPRDEAIRAAMRDAAVLAGVLEGEFQATYRGPERSEYVRVLTEIVAGLGGSLEAGAVDLAATCAEVPIRGAGLNVHQLGGVSDGTPSGNEGSEHVHLALGRRPGLGAAQVPVPHDAGLTRGVDGADIPGGGSRESMWI